MEGQDLLSLVKGRVYNAELRADLAKLGMRRINNQQWVSKATAAKYELIMTDDGDERVVTGVDILENNLHIHVLDPEAEAASVSSVEGNAAQLPSPEQQRMVNDVNQQLDVASFYFNLMDQWNYEIEMQTGFGREMQTLVKGDAIRLEDFFFLPDPLASGSYLFGTLTDDPAAQPDAWLELPNGQYVVPTDGSPDGAFDSLHAGVGFHEWERLQFETPAAAGQFAIKAINGSQSDFAKAIKKLLGKENGSVTRNDFYRNRDGQMCRIEIYRNPTGISMGEIPVAPTLADCIDCLLAPYIKGKAFSFKGY